MSTFLLNIAFEICLHLLHADIISFIEFISHRSLLIDNEIVFSFSLLQIASQ